MAQHCELSLMQLLRVLGGSWWAGGMWSKDEAGHQHGSELSSSRKEHAT